MDCATIVKRGYLYDKKMGLLPVAVDRKRWYILRRDLAQGYCLLEYYKDEKAAAKGAESIKGFINVHDVVEVRRVPEKKQTFEILCPGVGYRLMANSEVEADEWTDALKKLTLYRKDNLKPLSLQRTASTPTDPLAEMAKDQRKRTLSDSSPSLQAPPPLPPHCHSSAHPRSLAIPASTHPISSTDVPTINLSHSLPTPPENIGAPSFSPPTPPSAQPPPPPQILTKSVAELRAALPSPSTSSDSSSMCSGSNTSFDNQPPFEGEKNDSRVSKFRVHMKESENVSVSGPVDLMVSEDGISVHSIQTGQELVSWPIGALRRYGVNNVCFTIVTGRFCTTGEGRFQFYTQNSRLIHNKIHAIATQKAATTKDRSSMPRRESEPASLCDLPRQHTPLVNPNHSLPSHMFSTSPPSSTHSHHHQPYSHIHHAVVPPTSVEPYGKLSSHSSAGIHPSNSSALSAPDYSKLHHFTSGSMNSLLSAATAPAAAPSSTKPISCPPTPSHAQQQQQQQHFCPHCSSSKNPSFTSPNHFPRHHHPHHGSQQAFFNHTHMSHANHMTTTVVGGYVSSSSPTKNISLPPSVQHSGAASHVSTSPSFVTSYKPGPSLPSTFNDHSCSMSEASFTESCANFTHSANDSSALQSNV